MGADGEQLAGNLCIDTKMGAAIDLGGNIEPLKPFTHQLELRNILKRWRLRHRLTPGGFREFAISALLI